MPLMECVSGIIVKKIEYSNTSFIIHLFSPEQGMVHLLARGAKSRKSPFTGKLELFQEIRCHYVKTGKTNLYPLKECSRLSMFKKPGADLDVFFIWSFMTELVNVFPWDIDESKHIFQLLRTLFYLYETAPPQQYCPLLLFFTAKIISHLGYQPNTTQCCKTKRPLSGNILPVTYPEPGFIRAELANVHDRERYAGTISCDMLKTIQVLFELDDVSRLKQLALNECRDILPVFLLFIKSLAGKQLKTVSLLEQIEW